MLMNFRCAGAAYGRMNVALAMAGTVWNGDMPGDLKVVFFRLNKRQIPAYLVGPAVRDALLTESMAKVQRVDLIAAASSPQEVEKCLDSATTMNFFISRPERLRRNAVAFNIQDESTGEVVRRLVITVISNPDALKEELGKREVTVNALAMSAKGEIIDPFGGIEDLEKQQIRTIAPAAAIFVHRPLFLVKVAKHVAYHGFQVQPETEMAALRHAVNILDVPPERVRPDLERLTVNLHPELGLDFLERTGVLKFLLPEVQAMVGFDDSCQVHHKDIWAHTMKVVGKAKPNSVIRWAALLHDIGKVWTRTVDADGRVHFFRHEDLSAVLFKGIAARFGLEERLRTRIHFIIQNHSRINMYTSEWTDSAVRRLIRETDDHLDDLLALSRADITSRHERRIEELAALLEELEGRIRKIREQDSLQPLLPKGAGNIIMKHFGLPPGPVVGRLKDALEDALERRQLPPGLPVEDYLGFLQSYLPRQGKDDLD